MRRQIECIGRASVGVLTHSTDHDCVAIDPYRRTKLVMRRHITRGEFLHLSPAFNAILIALEDVGRTTSGEIYGPSPDHQSVAIDRYRNTEFVL